MDLKPRYKIPRGTQYTLTKVDIVIPGYNQSEHTIKLIRSINEYTDKHRIVYVDNGSDDKEYKRIKKELLSDSRSRHFCIALPENLGFIKATNVGIKAATSPFICLMNNDTVAEPFWMERMLEVFDKHPKAGMVGPTTIIAESWQNRNNLRKHWGDLLKVPESVRIESMLAFFCTVIKREVIKEVGLLDESYGIGFGDDDAYSEEVKKAGYELYVRTDVTIPHLHRTTFKKYIPDWEELQQENIKKFKAEYGAA